MGSHPIPVRFYSLAITGIVPGKMRIFFRPVGWLFTLVFWTLAAGVTLAQPSPSVRVPVLLFSASDEAGIASRIKADAALRGVHDLILRTADAMLQEAPVFHELKGKRLLDKATKARKRIFYLSYAWRMTRNQAYALRAKKEMLALVGFPDWNPSHFLDVAEITMALAVGYDWIYESLDQETRKRIEQAIIVKGLQTSFESGNDWWVDKDSNWNPICNAGMAFGAVVTRHVNRELAERILRRAESSVQLALSAYAPDGVYPEGYTYWSYGTTFLVMLLDVLESARQKVFTPATHPGLFKTADYLRHMIGPTGLNFNYSDGVANCSVNPAMFWFAGRLNDAGLLSAELNMLGTLRSMNWIPELPMVLVWGHSLDLKKRSVPADLGYIGHGKNPVAMFRSGWTDQAFYIGLKAGSASVSHGHMDVGSFILEALGERWAIDPGKQDYNKLESMGLDIWSFKQSSDRWKVFRNSNHSHNTLTFNGQLQYVQGHAPIIATVRSPLLQGAVTDLSKVYPYAALSVKRGVAILAKDMAVVRDEMVTRSGAAVNLQWSMVTPATVRIISRNKAELTLNGKHLYMTLSGSGDPELVTWQPEARQVYDEPLKDCVYIGLKTALPANRSISYDVIFSAVKDPVLPFGKIPALNEWNP